jgi:hypothetical protein
VCEILSPVWQAIIPRVASEKTAEGKMVSKPYDDLFPFLPREEYAREASFYRHDNGTPMKAGEGCKECSGDGGIYIADYGFKAECAKCGGTGRTNLKE